MNGIVFRIALMDYIWLDAQMIKQYSYNVCDVQLKYCVTIQSFSNNLLAIFWINHKTEKWLWIIIYAMYTDYF